MRSVNYQSKKHFSIHKISWHTVENSHVMTYSREQPIWVKQPMSEVPIFRRKKSDVVFRCLAVLPKLGCNADTRTVLTLYLVRKSISAICRRRCSSMLRWCRFSMYDVYIGWTLAYSYVYIVLQMRNNEQCLLSNATHTDVDNHHIPVQH